jgi:sec-independent protein translocase protein TatA
MIGPLELIVIAILILLVVGRNRLPEAGRSLGGGIRNFIDGIRNADDEDDEEAPEAIPARSESDRKPPVG